MRCSSVEEPRVATAASDVIKPEFESGRKHLIFGTAIRTWGPAHILQGMQDPDVPWKHALALVEHLAEDSVVLTLVKDGDHRLSGEADLARLTAAVARVA